MTARYFYEFGPFRLDAARRLLSKEGRIVPLTPKVLDTLLVLIENRGRVVGKEELMKALWPDTFVEEGNLAQHISALRRALGESPTEHAYIETIPKHGYHFVASVTQRAAGPRLTWRRTLLWVAAPLGVLGIAAVTFLFLGQRSRIPEPPPTSLAAVPLTSYPGFEFSPSFSPDGNQVAFSWNGERQDNLDIYVKLIGAEKPLRLTTHPASDSSPAWSPDGRSIAFHRDVGGGRAEVLLIPAIGGPERRLASVYLWPCTPAACSGLAWTPDGKWLATEDKTSSEQPWSVFLISSETGEKRRLTSPPPVGVGDTNAVFSPDGRTLAFCRHYARSDLCLLALYGDLSPTAEPTCLSLGGPAPGGLAWTRDGRGIVFSSSEFFLRPGLWRISVAQAGERLGVPRRLSLPGEGASDPAISRDGRRLAYTSLLPDTDIWRLEVPDPTQTVSGKAGQPVRLISSTRSDWRAQYSPDGKRIVFLSNRSGHPAVWVSASDGSDLMQLTSFPAPVTGWPRWSPDGQRIVFDSNLEGQYEIYVINADGGKPRRLTNNAADDAVASWSGDGRWIYFVSNRTGEWQVWKMPWSPSGDGGEATQVTRQGGYVASESPDGKFVYYSRAPRYPTSLWKVPVGGGEETKVLDSIPGRGFAVVAQGVYFWSANLEGSASLQFFSFATGRTTLIAAPQTDQSVSLSVLVGLSVSPDGRFILYSPVELVGGDLMLVENFR